MYLIQRATTAENAIQNNTVSTLCTLGSVRAYPWSDHYEAVLAGLLPDSGVAAARAQLPRNRGFRHPELRSNGAQ